MSDHSKTRYWLWGGLAGLLLQLALFALIQSLYCFHIDFGCGINSVLAITVILVVVILELPVVIIGRTLNLPIETGTPAFMVCNLTLFGYVLVAVFWTLVGLLIGYLIDRRLSVK